MKIHFHKLRIHCFTVLCFLAFMSMNSFNAISQSSPTPDGCQWRYINQLLEAKNYKAADELCEKCIESDSMKWIYYAGRAEAHRGMDPNDDKGLAFPFYKKMKDLMPNDFSKQKSSLSWYNEACLYQSNYYLVRKNFPSAGSCNESILYFTPDEPAAIKQKLKIKEERRTFLELRARQDQLVAAEQAESGRVKYEALDRVNQEAMVAERNRAEQAERDRVRQEVLDRERIARAAQVAAAKPAKVATRSVSNYPQFVRADQVGGNKVFMCSYCGTTVHKANGTGTPRGTQCSARDTNHQWNELGLAGGNTYSCRYCRVTVNLTEPPISNFRCPSHDGGAHRFEQL